VVIEVENDPRQFMVARFHHDANGNLSLKDHGFMADWAERAGEQVLKEVERPHEDNIVTFMNLALLWYAEGSWRRSYIHKGKCHPVSRATDTESDEMQAMQR
jgi:hypothetical protein